MKKSVLALLEAFGKLLDLSGKVERREVPCEVPLERKAFVGYVNEQVANTWRSALSSQSVQALVKP